MLSIVAAVYIALYYLVRQVIMEIGNSIKFYRHHKLALERVRNFVFDVCHEREPSHNHIHMETVAKNALWIAKWSIFLRSVTPIILAPFWFWLLNMYHPAQIDLPIVNIMSICLTVFLTYVMYQSIAPQILCFLVQVVGLLHDVADHKYIKHDPSLSQKLDRFIGEFCNDFYFLIMGSQYDNIFTVDGIKRIIERISFSKQQNSGTDDWLEVLGYAGLRIRNIVSDGDKWEAIGKQGIQRCASYSEEHLKKTGKEYDASIVRDDVIRHYHEKLKLIKSTQYMKTVMGWIWAQVLDREMNTEISLL
jgi:HD superfamily phosphodiesterase